MLLHVTIGHMVDRWPPIAESTRHSIGDGIWPDSVTPLAPAEAEAEQAESQ